MIAAIALAGALAGGGQYFLQRDPSQPTAAIDLWYRVPAAGFGNDKPGIARLAIAALAASSPPHGTSLAELVKDEGGTLNINVYPDIAMIGVSVAPDRAASVLHALTAAFFAPSISDAGFKAAQRDNAIASAEGQFDAAQLLQTALFSRLFSAGPAHYPVLAPDASALSQISRSDTAAFAQRAFRQPNAIVTLAGNVDPGLLANVHAGYSADVTAVAPLDSTLAPAAPPEATQTAQVAGLGFAWAGPAIADRKAATAMDFIADYLFDSEYGSVSQAIDKGSDSAYASGQFITLHDPGVLVFTISGAGAAAARDSVLKAAADMATPMDAKRFTAARNAFIFHILREEQTPPGSADNLGWYAAEGDAQYAPGDPSGVYLAAAESLDAGYVAQIAAKYLQHPAIVQLLAGTGGGSST